MLCSFYTFYFLFILIYLHSTPTLPSFFSCDKKWTPKTLQRVATLHVVISWVSFFALLLVVEKKEVRTDHVSFTYGHHVPNTIIVTVSIMFFTLFVLPCLRYGETKTADRGKFETSECQTREITGRQNCEKDSTAFGGQNSLSGVKLVWFNYVAMRSGPVRSGPTCQMY